MPAPFSAPGRPSTCALESEFRSNLQHACSAVAGAITGSGRAPIRTLRHAEGVWARPGSSLARIIPLLGNRYANVVVIGQDIRVVEGVVRFQAQLNVEAFPDRNVLEE